MDLRTRIYVVNPDLDGDGIYRPADWGKMRRAAEIAAVFELPTDESYRKVIAARADKISLARILCERIDFSRYDAIGEIGGAPYIQAQYLKSKFPNLMYLATDQDDQSNTVLQKIPMLSGLHINTFNVRTDDFSTFDACELILSFAVDYALTDEDIIKVMSYVARTGKTWGMLSVSIIDFPRYLRFRLGFFLRMLLRRTQRFHGWARSIRIFRSMAEQAGVQIKDLGMIGAYRALWFSSSDDSTLSR